MFHLQGVKLASLKEEQSDAASERPHESERPRYSGLARQARKLKNVFKRQEVEVHSSSAQLGQRHGKPFQGTQNRNTIPEHGQSSTASLPMSSNEQLHRLNGNTLEMLSSQVPNRVAPAPFYAGTLDQGFGNHSTRPKEPTKPKVVNPSPLPPAHPILDLNRTSSLLNSAQKQSPDSSQPQTSEAKRRRRRESHNLVERRRRDNINDLIQQLSRLVPLHRFKEYNAKLAKSRKTGESLDHGPAKGDILNGTVTWTRDLMSALYRKIQQEDTTKEYIDLLGGTWPFACDEDETRLQNEVIDTFEGNGKISVSPRPWDSDTKLFENSASAANAKGPNHVEHALRSKTSRGSLLSFSGSVHSFTSITYRSASGEIKTEHAETVSNFELSQGFIGNAWENKSRVEDWEVGEPQLLTPSKWNSMFLPSTQTFAASPTSEELKKPSSLGQERDGLRKSDKPSSKRRRVSRASLDSLNGSRRDDIFLDDFQRLNEAGSLAKSGLDLSVQKQTQIPIAAKMDEETGLQPIRLHEDSPLGLTSSIASSKSQQDLVESDPRVTYLENKFVRLRWKCSCKHPFQMDVLEHEKGAALAAIQKLDQSYWARDGSLGPLQRLSMFLVRIESLLHIFGKKRGIDETLPITNPSPTKADDINQTRQTPANPDPERYVCVCFPGMTYKKYLHHVDVNKTTDDQQLFAAMQQKYYDWKPFWRRMVTLRTLVRVEYFEFKIYYSNLVTIKEDWRDRFPQGHDPGEWSYNPTVRDMTPYLIDDVLTHYVHSPQCAKDGKYFWNRIPKKVYCKLECPNDKPFKVGWGLYFVEEFSQFYLMLILVPVLMAGVALAIWYCIWFHKSFADGATVVSGFAAVVMYVSSVAQGWYKQKGAL